MKDKGIVYGSKDLARPLIVNAETVYVHTDIKQDKDSGVWSYHETTYPLADFIELVSEKTTKSERELQETQVAMVSLFELLSSTEKISKEENKNERANNK